MRVFLSLLTLGLVACINAWAIDCNRAISDCVSKYREELAESKTAIKQIYKNSSDQIDISDYFYKGDKVCKEEIFKVGGECQGTKFNNYEYSQWQQKIEESHANDLVSMIKEKSEKKITKAFDLGKKYINEIKDELVEKVMQKGLSRPEANEQIKNIVILVINQQETYKTKAYWDVINSLYKDFDDRNFDESKLECFEPKCFDSIINKKLENLESEKSRFLNNTKSILEHIKS